MNADVITKAFSKFYRVFNTLVDFSRLSYDIAEANAILEFENHDVQSSSIRGKKLNEEYKKQLSIILPTYNRGALVRNAIESVLMQDTHYEYELIIINDGSQDNTHQILEEYAQYDNIVIIHQKNKGFSGARNAGLEMATGQYIMFIDDDDKLLPKAIERLMDIAVSKNVDIVEGAAVNVFQNGEKKKRVQLHTGEATTAVGYLSGFAWGKVYARKLFTKIKFPENYWFEDSINSMLIFSLAKEVFITSDFVYEYYQHDTNISKISMANKKSIDSFYITRQLLNDRKDVGLENQQEQYEYFLRMVALTYERTKLLNEKVKKAIFVLQCNLWEQYFSSFRTNEHDYRKELEQCVQRKKYKRYVICCEFHI